jgi:hypothetical protein
MADVNWYTDDVMVVFDEISQEIADRLVLEIMGQAVLNIRSNNQIDTGFMMNSVYVESKTFSNYNNTPASGEGQRERAKPVRIVGDTLAAVAVGANYAIFPESRKSFLYKAANDVATNAGGILEAVGKEFLD